MTEQLQYAIKRLQQLPVDAQNAIAERILNEIDEQEWDDIVRNPSVQQHIRALADQAWQEHEAGETEEGGFAVE